MSKNLYVGNLSFEVTSDDLRDTFAEFGTVTSATVVMDRDTGRSRGFGFVEMAHGSEQAIEKLNGAEIKGRKITVNEARPREERGGGGGGGRGGRGGGGGGGRRY
jgi:RNA recognition motif-containing protein